MIKNTLLVLGAKSDIGIAVAHKFAQEGFDIQLAARNAISLERECSKMMKKFTVNASFHEFNALNFNSHEKFISSLPYLPTVVISTVGYLGTQKTEEREIKKIIEIIRINFEGVAGIFGIIANHFEKRGTGTLIGISSVAGDRGKASNYLYGSAKAGLSAYLSGLRNRLYPHGVDVITVKPGYVETKMTSHMNLPKSLTTTPRVVADHIYEAYKNKKKIIYIKPIWKYIMKIIGYIPETIFMKLKL